MCVCVWNTKKSNEKKKQIQLDTMHTMQWIVLSEQEKKTRIAVYYLNKCIEKFQIREKRMKIFNPEIW